jgi:hypothetical protein
VEVIQVLTHLDLLGNNLTAVCPFPNRGDNFSALHGDFPTVSVVRKLARGPPSASTGLDVDGGNGGSGRPSQSERSPVIPVRTVAGEEVNEVVTIVTSAAVLRFSSVFIDEEYCVGVVGSWPCLMYECCRG